MKTVRKLLCIIFAVVLTFCTIPFAFADDESCQHNNMRHIAEGELGAGGYLCREYWQCQDCWALFSDEAGTQALYNDQIYTIPCTNHDLRYCAQGSSHNGHGYLCVTHWACRKCNQDFSDAAATQVLTYEELYSIACEHSKMKHYKAGQRSSDGYLCVEHWFCDDCDLYFANEAGTQVLYFNQVYTIPCPHDHLIYQKGYDPGCGETGEIAHWRCSDCDKLFADETKTQELTYDEVNSVTSDYDEHEYLYDLGFEESADHCWLSLGFMRFLLLNAQAIQAIIDNQSGTIIYTWDSENGYTETETLAFKYCGHCGAYVAMHYFVTDQNGNVLSGEDEFGALSSGPFREMAYLHQPGPVENDLVGYTEMPTSADGLTCGDQYFDLDACIEDMVKEIDVSDPNFGTEENAMNYVREFVEYFSTARAFCFDEDKSVMKLVFSDDFITDGAFLSDIVNIADYVKTITNDCTHVWNDGIVTTNPGCTKPGVKTFTCTLCGNTKTQTIPAAHGLINGFDEETVTATCKNSGYYMKTCLDCTEVVESQNYEKDPTNHANYGTQIKNAADPTCTVDGYTGDTVCKGCDAVLQSGSVIPAAHGLINGFDEETVTATCKNPGYYMKTCLDCTEVVESQNYEKDPSNHANYGTQIKNAADPTCTVDGYTGDTVCKGCDAVLQSGSVIPAAHGLINGFDEETVTATCKNPGYYMKTCLDCTEVVESQNYEKDPNNHVGGTELRNASESTCTEPGYTGDTICLGCEAKLADGRITAAKGHAWGEWSVTAEPTYLTEGSKVRVCQRQECKVEETETIPKLIPEQSAKNEETGTTVGYQDGVVPEDTRVVVDEEYDGTSFRLLNNEKGNYQKVMFNITLESGGQKIQPNGYVLVRIPLPEGFSPEKICVYYVSGDDNRFERIDCYVENGFVCFETTHFSDYAIVDESSEVKPTEPTTDSDKDKTPDQPSGKVCKFCGQVHTGFFQKIIGFFHSILALFGLKKK